MSFRLEMIQQNEDSLYLVKTLQALLMILPLSKSFEALKSRLECLNIAYNKELQSPVKMHSEVLVIDGL